MRRIVSSLLVVLFMVAGCSPEYNWRQLDVGDGLATALFPEKAITQARPLSFAGHEINFHLTSAVVGEASFTVAHAALPPALHTDTVQRLALGKAVIESLYRNLGATVPEPLPAFGESFSVTGAGPGGELHLRAVVWVTSSALIEGLVTAPSDRFPAQAADDFMGGLVVAR